MKPAPSPLNIAQLMSQAAYDVIVIGAGGAGMSAALYAAIAGKSVLLVERTEFLGGTTAWSAATTWIPGTAVGAVTRATSAQAPDTLVQVKQFLDAAVGVASLEQMRQAFIDNGAAAVAQIQAHSSVQYRARSLHPDYMTELAGSTLNGRAIEPEPFDGRLLGNDIRLIRPPIPEFTVLGGMMVDRDNIAALLSLSKSWASFSHGAKIIVRHCIDKVFHPRSTRLVMGNALIGRLLHSLKVRGVDIATHTQVTDFEVQNGVIRGITVQQNGVIKSIATGAVILASGGFNRNPGLRAALLPGVDMAWCVGAPGHTGEALELATGQGAYFGECRVSAERSHAFLAPVSLRQRADGTQAVFPHFLMDRGKPGMLVINQLGERFLNESMSYHRMGMHLQVANQTVPSVPAYLICDAPALKRYGIGMVRPNAKPADLAPFIADGYLVAADSLYALAAQLMLPAHTLQTTIAQHNANAELGIDPQFHRGETVYQRNNGDASQGLPNPCLGTLNQAPYYAVRLYPGDIGASTGLVTNTHAQVLCQDGTAIQGLYAIGNDMHSIMGGIYPAPGITIGPGLVFAYIATQHITTQATSQL
jgi:hypothetical protein